MSDPIRGTSEEALRALCQQAIELARSLPGPLRRIAVRSTDNTVEVEWPIGDAAQPLTTVSRPLTSVPDETPTADVDAAAHIVRAPLVGTFYRAPKPDAEPFVAVGDIVEVGQTVAIVETMKLLNHIVTEVAGRVVEICLSDGESVEFEQPLMRILPLVDDEAT
ncbi:MAG: acetyl-CoA carboxylase biotin carboxyl carrier protein [Pseudonocardiaceae bacterium]